MIASAWGNDINNVSHENFQGLHRLAFLRIPLFKNSLKKWDFRIRGTKRNTENPSAGRRLSALTSSYMIFGWVFHGTLGIEIRPSIIWYLLPAWIDTRWRNSKIPLKWDIDEANTVSTSTEQFDVGAFVDRAQNPTDLDLLPLFSNRLDLGYPGRHWQN